MPWRSTGQEPARLLFVHAHPDDETLTTGLTMAHYRAAGHQVHVLTCTLGEEGEVIPAGLAHLCADREDRLGPWRREELRRAMAVLDVEHTLLGEDPAAGVASRYRDSGMAATPAAAHPRAFVGADVDEAAGLMAAELRRIRPQVVVTYDAHGGYGHPDHIQTRRVVLAALRRLEPPEAPAAVYEILTPRSWAAQDRRWLAAHVPSERPELRVPAPDWPLPPSVVQDARVSHVVADPAVLDRQRAALAEHRTQVSVFDGFYALSNGIAARLPGREGFARLGAAGTGVTTFGMGAARHTGLLPEEVS